MDYKPHLDRVTEAVKELGYENISPESLTALRADEYAYSRVSGSYNIVMHGFRQLFNGVQS